jgi:hypothetical protein
MVCSTDLALKMGGPNVRLGISEVAAARRRTAMIDKSMLALIFAVPAVSVGVEASAKYVRKLCGLVFGAAQHVYASHIENVQMRLAPSISAMDRCRQQRQNHRHVI